MKYDYPLTYPERVIYSSIGVHPCVFGINPLTCPERVI
jgi:hypothetical protein